WVAIRLAEMLPAVDAPEAVVIFAVGDRVMSDCALRGVLRNRPGAGIGVFGFAGPVFEKGFSLVAGDAGDGHAGAGVHERGGGDEHEQHGQLLRDRVHVFGIRARAMALAGAWPVVSECAHWK